MGRESVAAKFLRNVSSLRCSFKCLSKMDGIGGNSVKSTILSCDAGFEACDAHDLDVRIKVNGLGDRPID